MFYFLNLHRLRKIFNRTFMDIDLIVPLWNRKNNKTSVDGQTLQGLWIQTLWLEPISTIVDSSQKARGCPGLGRGFFVLCVNANFMKLQSRVIIRIATSLEHNPITLLV